jgi:hypothetical protein
VECTDDLSHTPLLVNVIIHVHVSLSIDYKVKIASLEGIEAIIKAMSSHRHSAVVQEMACSALRCLASKDGLPTSFLLISLFIMMSLYRRIFLICSISILCLLICCLTTNQFCLLAIEASFDIAGSHRAKA